MKRTGSYVVALALVCFLGWGLFWRKPQPILAPLPAPQVKLLSAVRSVAIKQAWQKSLAEQPKVRSNGQTRRNMSLWAAINSDLKDLALTPDEAQTLMNDLEAFDDVRNEIEGRLIHESSYDGSTLKLHVPAYPEDGSILRELLYGQLEQDFSPDRTESIFRLFANHLESYFHGFGSVTQDYVITHTSDTPANDLYSIKLVGGLRPGTEAGSWASTITDSVTGLQGSSYSVLADPMSRRFGRN